MLEEFKRLLPAARLVDGIAAGPPNRSSIADEFEALVEEGG
jgi:hypothetical protein